MVELFVKVIADDGTESYEIVEVENIAEDVVKEHPTYKSVLAESVSRRQTIAELKKTLTQPDESEDEEEGEEEETTPPTQQTQTPIEPIDKVALLQELKEQLRAEEEAEIQAKTEYEGILNKVATEHNVNPLLLRGSTEQELADHAALLAKEGLQFSSLGSNQSQPSEETVLAGLNERFGFND